jgi:hypothetical protein
VLFFAMGVISIGLNVQLLTNVILRFSLAKRKETRGKIIGN